MKRVLGKKERRKLEGPLVCLKVTGIEQQTTIRDMIAKMREPSVMVINTE